MTWVYWLRLPFLASLVAVVCWIVWLAREYDR
jgi:hypothetical protein